MKLNTRLSQLAADADENPAWRCEKANFRWDEAVSSNRSHEYNTYVDEPHSYKEWRAEHNNYLKTFVQIPRDFPRSCESFTAMNSDAHLREDMDDTLLVRLESLGRVIANPLIAELAEIFWLRFYHSQNDLTKTSLPHSVENLLVSFVAQWNELRTQTRPLFATFLNDFGGDLKALIKSDWPHILRDRLGLTHWPGAEDKDLPVALMCYKVSEVREARLLAAKKGAVASFTRPTVIDAEMSSAFIPAPIHQGEKSYGYTLDLSSPEQATGIFTSEILNFPIEYQPHHIKALGYITRKHILTDQQKILEARNSHIKNLQDYTGRTNFGEVLK